MQYIYESTTDGTIESLLATIKVAYNLGIFDDAVFKEMKFTFTQTMGDVLQSEIRNIPNTKRAEFMRYANGLRKPIESANDMKSFIKAIVVVIHVKKAIISRLSIEETNLKENISSTLRKLKDSISQIGKGSVELGSNYIKKLSLLVVSILVNYISNILRTISTSL